MTLQKRFHNVIRYTLLHYTNFIIIFIIIRGPQGVLCFSVLFTAAACVLHSMTKNTGIPIVIKFSTCWNYFPAINLCSVSYTWGQ